MEERASCWNKYHPKKKKKGGSYIDGGLIKRYLLQGHWVLKGRGERSKWVAGVSCSRELRGEKEGEEERWCLKDKYQISWYIIYDDEF